MLLESRPGSLSEAQETRRANIGHNLLVVLGKQL
jgi:hypothetical protein